MEKFKIARLLRFKIYKLLSNVAAIPNNVICEIVFKQRVSDYVISLDFLINEIRVFVHKN